MDYYVQPHTTKYYKALPRSTTDFYLQQRTARYCKVLQRTAKCCKVFDDASITPKDMKRPLQCTADLTRSEHEITKVNASVGRAYSSLLGNASCMEKLSISCSGYLPKLQSPNIAAPTQLYTPIFSTLPFSSLL